MNQNCFKMCFFASKVQPYPLVTIELIDTDSADDDESYNHVVSLQNWKDYVKKFITV